MRSDEDRAMDADIQAAEPPILVKMASAAQGITGMLTALTGLQVIDVTWRVEWANWVPRLLILLGVTAVGLAAMQYRARSWAGVASAVQGVLLAAAMMGWLFYTFTSVASCLMYAAVPLSVLSAMLSLITLGAIRRTAAARQRLADRGMNLGL